MGRPLRIWNRLSDTTSDSAAVWPGAPLVGERRRSHARCANLCRHGACFMAHELLQGERELMPKDRCDGLCQLAMATGSRRRRAAVPADIGGQCVRPARALVRGSGRQSLRDALVPGAGRPFRCSAAVHGRRLSACPARVRHPICQWTSETARWRPGELPVSGH